MYHEAGLRLFRTFVVSAQKNEKIYLTKQALKDERVYALQILRQIYYQIKMKLILYRQNIQLPGNIFLLKPISTLILKGERTWQD